MSSSSCVKKGRRGDAVYDRQALIALVRDRALRFGDFTLASGKKAGYYMDGKQITLLDPLFIMDNPHIANLGPRSASVAALEFRSGQLAVRVQNPILSQPSRQAVPFVNFQQFL